jgi:membrane protein required for colicin V production
MTSGFTWLDWVILVLVLVFAVRGLARGTLGQVFGLAGLVAGLWTASWVAQWVGLHWESARPTAVFWALRWLVAILTGLAAASLFEWLSHQVREAVDATPAKWLDRLGGMLVGAVTGAFVAAMVTVVVVLSSWAPAPIEKAAIGRLAAPTLGRAAQACALARGFFPGIDWLEQQIEAAQKRLKRHTVI